MVSNVPDWWGMSGMAEAVRVWGQGNDGKSRYLPFNFAVNLKIVVKIKAY